MIAVSKKNRCKDGHEEKFGRKFLQAKNWASSLMRWLGLVPLIGLIVACAPQDVPLPSLSAQFENYPERLFKTFEIGCDGPGEQFQRLGNRVFECSELLPPDTTAYLILNYDGYPQDLPTSVMRLTSTKNSTGYRVDADLYFDVPRRTGPAVQVPVESETLDKALTALYQAMGGSPAI